MKAFLKVTGDIVFLILLVVPILMVGAAFMLSWMGFHILRLFSKK